MSSLKVIPRNFLRFYSRKQARLMSTVPTSKFGDDNFEKVEDFANIASTCFEFSKVSDDIYRPKTLKNVRQGARAAAYGGLVFAQALAAAEKTVDDQLKVHSVHSYFILNVDTEVELTYNVKRIRDGRSFATRCVEAIQNGKIAFTMIASFHVEESHSIQHQSQMPDVPPPSELLSMRDAVPWVKERVAKGEISTPPGAEWRLHKYDSNIYSSDTDLFEMRSTNLGNFYAFDSDKNPRLFFWMRARGDLPDDDKLHRYLISYNTDAILVATALSPHFSNNFISSMTFSLDHTVWYHKNDVRADEWLLFETKSHFAGSGRTLIEGRIWQSDGSLVLSCQQEALVRTRGEPSRL